MRERERFSYLGGYDASAISGQNPYKTPLSVYLEKTGVETVQPPPSLAMELGLYLEPWVLEKAEKLLGEMYQQEVKITHRQDFIVHPKYDFIAGHIDGICEIAGEKVLIDAKTTEIFNRGKWDAEAGEVPAVALWQIYHYFGLLPDVKYAYIAVLIGNRTLDLVRVERIEDSVRAVMAAEVDFWQQYVEPRITPPVEMISRYDGDFVKGLFPASEEYEKVFADNDIEEDARALVEAKEAIKELENAVAMYQARLEYALGCAERGKAGDVSFSWKSQDRTSVSTKKLKEKYPEIYAELSETTSSRVFRIKTIGGKNGKS